MGYQVPNSGGTLSGKRTSGVAQWIGCSHSIIPSTREMKAVRSQVKVSLGYMRLCLKKKKKKKKRKKRKEKKRKKERKRQISPVQTNETIQGPHPQSTPSPLAQPHSLGQTCFPRNLLLPPDPSSITNYILQGPKDTPPPTSIEVCSPAPIKPPYLRLLSINTHPVPPSAGNRFLVWWDGPGDLVLSAAHWAVLLEQPA